VHVTLTRVSTSDEPIENASIVGVEMERWLRDIEGFEGFVILSTEGTSIGLTFWASREIAEKLRPMRMQFVERVMSAARVQIEEVVDYEVTFARLGALSVTPPT
jgi:hypothetical protein